MITFDIELSGRARKDLSLLKSDTVKKIFFELQKLSISPFPDKKKIKKIRGVKSPLYRLRVDAKTDSYRVFYVIVSPNKLLLLRIVSKKYADRIIKRIKGM